MRGKALAHSVAKIPKGITPAYAGKRMGGLKMAQDFEDHPRLCGEKFTMPSSVCIPKGSPPPMRGKAHTSVFPRSSVRITPAYAGKREL